jgi:DNA-binding MarR family transcriptional regulator
MSHPNIIDNQKIPVYTAIMENQNPQRDQDAYSRVVTSCTNANLRKTSRLITQLYDEFLQPSGLLGTQFRLLGAVAASGTIALTPLAEELELDPTTLARNLKPLERDGLVEVSIGEDRRTRTVKITEKGQSALLKALPLWEEAQAWVISQLGENRWQAMLADWTELVSMVRQR